MAEEWLSYQQIGAALSISSAAARHKTARYRFARRLRNDGRAEVLVDVEDLRARMPLRGRSAGAPSPAETALDTRSIAVLQARIAELEQEALSARSEAERERAERLDERERADRLAGEVAELARKLAALVERVAPPKPSVPSVSSNRRGWWWRRAG